MTSEPEHRELDSAGPDLLDLAGELGRIFGVVASVTAVVATIVLLIADIAH
jgi:hypothetical protein